SRVVSRVPPGQHELAVWTGQAAISDSRSMLGRERREHLTGVEGLSEKMIEVALFEVVTRVPTDPHERALAKLGLGSKDRQQGVTIDDRHTDIHDHDVWNEAVEEAKPVRRAVTNAHLEACVVEHCCNPVCEVLVVVDDEDAPSVRNRPDAGC